jgi:hypothetical protein
MKYRWKRTRLSNKKPLDLSPLALPLYAPSKSPTSTVSPLSLGSEPSGHYTVQVSTSLSKLLLLSHTYRCVTSTPIVGNVARGVKCCHLLNTTITSVAVRVVTCSLPGKKVTRSSTFKNIFRSLRFSERTNRTNRVLIFHELETLISQAKLYICVWLFSLPFCSSVQCFPATCPF